MSSFNGSDLDLSVGSSSQSRILTESFPHNDDDLSLSELSLSDRYNTQPKFSLFARPQRDNLPTARSPIDTGETLASREKEDEHLADATFEHEKGDDAERPSPTETRPARPQLDREEQLQADAFMLRKLNAAMAHYLETLDYAESANNSLATRLGETDALLNKYIGILQTSEEFTRIIFDEQWEGAEGDEQRIVQLKIEAEERARREAEEQARQRQKVEQERKEREARLEREKMEREQKEKVVARGGVRGVRGTRASMRSRIVPSAVTRGRARGSGIGRGS